MKIRFISDIHYYLNLETEPTEFESIMSKMEPADVTLIAGDLNCDTVEAMSFLQRYFPNEQVVFTGGNHTLAVYKPGNTIPIQDVIANHKATFNAKRFGGLWHFLENDYIQLSEKVFCIGCCGWTNFEYGHQTKSQYVREIEREKRYREKHQTVDTGEIFGKGTDFDHGVQPVHFCGPELPDDPAAYYDEIKMGDKEGYRGRRMRDAIRHMNDYNYGKIRRSDGSIDILRPLDTYNMHQESLKYIEKAYKEIVEKCPDATIILMTHHPFSTKCVSGRFKDDPLTSAFVSPHDRWLKKFDQIKYIHCGHVHQRFFTKLGDKQLICNSLGYLYYYEHKQAKPFNINYIVEV